MDSVSKRTVLKLAEAELELILFHTTHGGMYLGGYSRETYKLTVSSAIKMEDRCGIRVQVSSYKYGCLNVVCQGLQQHKEEREAAGSY